METNTIWTVIPQLTVENKSQTVKHEKGHSVMLKRSINQGGV